MVSQHRYLDTAPSSKLPGRGASVPSIDRSHVSTTNTAKPAHFDTDESPSPLLGAKQAALRQPHPGPQPAVPWLGLPRSFHRWEPTAQQLCPLLHPGQGVAVQGWRLYSSKPQTWQHIQHAWYLINALASTIIQLHAPQFHLATAEVAGSCCPRQKMESAGWALRGSSCPRQLFNEHPEA